MNTQTKNQTKGKDPPGGSGTPGDSLGLNPLFIQATEKKNSKKEFYQINQKINFYHN